MNEFMILLTKKQTQQITQELKACNSLSIHYGLILNEDDINELIECRKEAIKASGRVEMGEGILPHLIYAFCDSPYINQENYKETLICLQEAFYYYKSELHDVYDDEILIDFMVRIFNHEAGGSLDYLIQSALEELVRGERHVNQRE